MKAKYFGIGWIVTVAMQLTACYTSSLIDPGQEGDAYTKQKLYRSTIRSVLTKDGMEYRFDRRPDLFADAIVGEAKIRVTEGVMTQQVSIPLREVAVIGVKEKDWTATAAVVAVLGVVTGVVIIATTVDATIP